MSDGNGKRAVDTVEMGCPVMGGRPSECNTIHAALNAIHGEVRKIREEHGKELKAISKDVSRIKGKLNMRSGK